MNTRIKPATLAAVCLVSAAALSGAAMASTPHHGMRGQERYSEACSTLASQWNDAIGGHNHGRHLSSARRQESIGERDCRSHRVAELKAGTEHYRTALRLLGVRPRA